jgi:hypothetical protein
MTRTLVAFVFLACASPLFAQYEMRKSADGILLVSQARGRTYTLDIPGKTIVPYGDQQADHPYLTVDGVFLQVLSVPLAEFKADANASDEAVLRQQMQYEATYYKVPVSQIESHTRKVAGRTTLAWSFMPTVGPLPVRQVFLTFRSGSYVVVIGSSVERGQGKSSIESLLARIASSFHAT